MTSHVLNFDFQLLLGTLLGSLEGKVLQKVSNAIVLRSLVPGTGIDPNAHSSSLASYYRLGSNS